jgi:AraC-like DNA-binding protein
MLLIILPLVLGIALMLETRNVISNQIQQHGELTVQHFEAQASAILRESQMVGSSLLSDTEFIYDLDTSSSENFDPDELVARIALYTADCEYIDKIYVVSNNQDRVYSDNGVYVMDSLPALLNSMGSNMANLYSGLDEGWNMGNGNYKSPFFMMRIPDRDGDGYSGTIFISLKWTMFLRILYSTDAEMCSLFNENYFISTVPNLSETPDWYSEKSMSELLGTTVKCIYIEEPSFTYMVAVSTESYYAPVRVILWSFAIYFVAVLLGGGIYLMYISGKRYRRIDGLISSLPQYVSENATDNEIFSAITSSLNEYKERDKSESERARADNMRRIIHGNYGDNETPEIFTAAGIPWNAERYYVATFFINEFIVFANGKSNEERDIIDVIIHSTLLKAAAGVATVASVDVLTDRGRYPYYSAVICPNPDVDEKETVTKIIENVNSFLSESYGVDLRCTVSHEFTSPKEIHDAYLETKSLYSFLKSVDSDRKLLMQEDMETGISILNGNYFKQLQILMNTLNIKKYETIPAMVEALLNEHIRPLKRNYELVQDRMNGLASILSEAVRSERPSATLDTEKEAQRLMDNVASTTKFSAVVNDIFTKLSSDEEKVQENDIVTQACEYIDNNIDDQNLTVPVICEAIGISVQHLSRLFKQKRDITVTEYINSRRTSLAKEKLQNKKITVAAVASQVGYGSTETFTRNFRRYEGITPTEYRNTLT